MGMAENWPFTLVADLHGGLTGAHLGAKKTLGRVKTHYWWESVRQDVFEHCDNCVICRSRRSGRAPGTSEAYPCGRTLGVCGCGCTEATSVMEWEDLRGRVSGLSYQMAGSIPSRKTGHRYDRTAARGENHSNSWSAVEVVV